jgi:subtilisin
MEQTTSTTSEPRLTWRLRDKTPGDIAVLASAATLPPAWGGATGRGVRVCVVDSGVERDHPLVGAVQGSWAVVRGLDDECRVEETDSGDDYGHGTACAGIIRRNAPECELYSLRVLGRNAGTGDMLLAGLRWAVEQNFDVINLSLSTTRLRFIEQLRALTDEAFFRRTAIVASAHNTPIESFPWRFASVISVGSHHETDPDLYLYNPAPPVEFFAPGQDIPVAWIGGSSKRSTGNSFATPFIAGLCASILSKHPRMTTFQLKTALYLSAANVRVEPGGAP